MVFAMYLAALELPVELVKMEFAMELLLATHIRQAEGLYVLGREGVIVVNHLDQVVA
jgi:hypothetical protein